MPHRLMYFEGLDGGPTQDRVCRGGTIYDNRAEYFSVYWTSTLEGCKSQCVEISDCKGRDRVRLFLWTLRSLDTRRGDPGGESFA